MFLRSKCLIPSMTLIFVMILSSGRHPPFNVAAETSDHDGSSARSTVPPHRAGQAAHPRRHQKVSGAGAKYHFFNNKTPRPLLDLFRFWTCSRSSNIFQYMYLERFFFFFFYIYRSISLYIFAFLKECSFCLKQR